MGAREVGPWVGEQKPLGKSPLRGNPSPESTYLPTTSSTLTLVLPLSTSFRLALAGVVAFAFASTIARAFARIFTLKLRR